MQKNTRIKVIALHLSPSLSLSHSPLFRSIETTFSLAMGAAAAAVAAGGQLSATAGYKVLPRCKYIMENHHKHYRILPLEEVRP